MIDAQRPNQTDFGSPIMISYNTVSVNGSEMA